MTSYYKLPYVRVSALPQNCSAIASYFAVSLVVWVSPDIKYCLYTAVVRLSSCLRLTDTLYFDWGSRGVGGKTDLFFPDSEDLFPTATES